METPKVFECLRHFPIPVEFQKWWPHRRSAHFVVDLGQEAPSDSAIGPAADHVGMVKGHYWYYFSRPN